MHETAIVELAVTACPKGDKPCSGSLWNIDGTEAQWGAEEHTKVPGSQAFFISRKGNRVEVIRTTETTGEYADVKWWWLNPHMDYDFKFLLSGQRIAVFGKELLVTDVDGSRWWRAWASEDGWLTLQSNGHYDCSGSACWLGGFLGENGRIFLGDDPSSQPRRGLTPGWVGAAPVNGDDAGTGD